MFRTQRLAAPVAACLLALPAGATDLTGMTDAERAAFRDEVRAYLLDNPEVLMEAISVLEQRQAEAQADGDAAMIAAHASQLFDDPGSWVGGNPEGSVTIVEFFDYRCSYCKRAHPEVSELLAGDQDIRFIKKEFPILGEQSLRGSRYALAVRHVAGDETYKEVSDTLMTLRGDLDAAALKRVSETFDLDHAAIEEAMLLPEIEATIARNRQLATTLQINGTPSFIFGDQMVRGYVPLETMQQLVDEAREG